MLTLRRPLTRFVGRADVLQALRQRWECGERLITLAGPPGIGKTRVAVEFAWSIHDLVDDAWLCDLSSVATTRELVASVARTVGVEAAVAGASRVGAALATRGRAVLLLDNAEAIASAAGPVISDWLEHGAGLSVIVTTRQVVGATQERPLWVTPLSMADGIALFVDRAKALGTEVPPTASVTARLAQLISRLEHNPLAIELAAGRTTLLGIDDLLDRLEHRFDTLVRPAGSDRGSSFYLAIEASWRLLEPAQRATLAACSVFHGSFTIAAACAAIGSDTAEQIDALVARSLLVIDPAEDRRYMLDSIREFVQLQPELTRLIADARARLATFIATLFASYVEAPGDGPPATEAELVVRERDNGVAVCRWLLAQPASEPRDRQLAVTLEGLDPSFLGFAPAPVDALIEAAVARGVEDPVTRGRLLALRGRARSHASQFEEALADLHQSLALAETASDARLAAAARAGIGQVLLGRGEIAAAKTALATAAHALEILGPPPLAVHARRWLGAALNWGAEYDAAEMVGREALAIARRTGDDLLVRMTGYTLGLLMLEAGRIDDAIAPLEESASRTMAPPNIPTAFDWLPQFALAALAREHGHLELARTRLHTAHNVLLRSGALGYIIVFLHGCALVEIAAGDMAAAADWYRRALDAPSLGPTNDAVWMAMAALAMAFAGDVDGGRRLARRAAATATTVQAAPVPTLLELARAGVEIASVDATDDAWHRAAKALERARQARARTQEVRLAESVLRGELTRVALVADHATATVTLPGGTTLSLEGRPVHRALLATLLAGRHAHPGRAVTRKELVEAAWPGQKMSASSADNRLKVAIARLRRAGLRDLLRTEPAGYLLDPAVPAVLAPDPRALWADPTCAERVDVSWESAGSEASAK
jgi:hypothetical protein